MQQSLYAFWKYDLFPYYLSGEIDHFDGRGRVRVAEYKGYFTPAFILPASTGRELAEKLVSLRAEWEQAQNELRNAYKSKLDFLLDEFVLTGHP